MRDTWWYELDAEDRVVDVGPGWDDFALDNQAPTATRDRVVGRPFYSHVEGSETRSLLKMVFDRTRALKKPVELPFRCDAPGVRRFMTFTSEVTHGGGLRITTRLLGEGKRDALRFLVGPGSRGREPIRVCSWCNRIAAEPGVWLEAESAAERMGLLLDPQVPVMTHGICPRCQRGVMGSLVASEPAEDRTRPASV